MVKPSRRWCDNTLGAAEPVMPERVAPPRARSGDPVWQTDGRDWPHRETSGFWRCGGFVWHVQRQGQGPQMLLLHGTAAGSFSWADLVDQLSDQFEMIRIDLPGHGFTQAPRAFRPSLPNMCQALTALLSDMACDPQILVGHSAGAAIALKLASTHKAKPKLIVSINGALKPFDGLMRMIAPVTAKVAAFGGLAARMVAGNAAGEARIRVLVENTGSDPDLISLSPYAALMRRRGHIQGALKMMANWDLSAMMRDCARIDAPVLFIAGQTDKAVPPHVSEQAAGRVGRGTYLELNKLGHLAHEENPRAVAEAILEAWERAIAED